MKNLYKSGNIHFGRDAASGQSHHGIWLLKQKKKWGCGGVSAPPQPHNSPVFRETSVKTFHAVILMQHLSRWQKKH